MVCRRITWAIIVDTRTFFDDIKLAEDFIKHGDYLQFPVSTIEGNLMSIKHGIKIERQNFPLEWVTPEPKYAPQVPYYPGKPGGGGYQPGQQSLIPPLGGMYQPPSQKKTMHPYNWRPANWVDKRHPKIAAKMEPFLTKFCGWCSVSNILTAGNKWLDSRPRLNAYPAGICWLHSIDLCPYGTQCSFPCKER